MPRLLFVVAMLLVCSCTASSLAQDQPKPPAKMNSVQAALKRERARDLRGAMKLLSDEIAAHPTNADAYFHRGRIGLSVLRFQADLEEQVEADLNKALELRPNEAAWRAVRAEWFAQIGKGEQAVEDLNEALKQKPQHVPYLLQRGLAYSQIGKLKEAASDNEAAAKLKPDFAFAWINATDVYVRLGDSQNAIRTGEQAIKVAAGIPMAQLNCGRAYLLDFQFTAAEERFNESLKLVPNFPQAYFYRAELHSLLGNIPAARNDYYVCAALNPADVQSRLLFAETELACGNYESAMEICDWLCKQAPDDAVFHLEAARCWAALEEAEKALAALKVAENPETRAQVESMRGDLLWQQGDITGARKAYDAALAEYDRRVAASPDNAGVRLSRANFLAHQRQDAKALTDLQAVVAQSPRDFAAANSLAWLYATTADKNVQNAREAVALATKASAQTLDRHDSYLDTKAAAHAAAGDFAEAVRIQKLALAAATPRNAVLYRRHLLAYTNRQPWREPVDAPQFSVRILADPIDPNLKVDRFQALIPAAAPVEEKKLADVIEQTKDAIVLLEHDQGGGTGMLISEQGHVLTCAHVLPLRGALKVTFERSEGKERVSTTLAADILAVDHVRDLALVQMHDAAKLPTVKLGLWTKVSAGDKVAAIGNPLAGGKAVLRQVATDGIVSNSAQKVGTHKRQDRIQTTAIVAPGCSGGPLLNMRGEAIGVVAARIDAAQAGFAIPMSDVAKFLGVKRP